MENEEPVIYVNEADKVFITLPEDSVNDFTDGSTRIDDTLDAVIFSRSDLTINGQGTLNITANFYNGIESKDDLRISGGVINITALNHALNANDAINIQGAILDLTAGKDGIHSENDDDKTLGNVYLNPVKLTISATEDGIDAYHLLEVAGGEIDIIQSTEGMEAMVIHQTGGNVSILSSDDGINASDGSSTSEGMFMQVNNALQIVIDDGKLTINAEGDGIDSNGTVTINGGEIYVQGSQINENGALDAEGGVIVNGGTVLAMGTAQMVQGMISGADQASIMLNINGQAGSVVKISDNTGKILASFTATKAFQIINATVPGMVEGETYKVEVDNNLVEVTASTQAQMMNMGGIPGAGFGGRP